MYATQLLLGSAVQADMFVTLSVNRVLFYQEL